MPFGRDALTTLLDLADLRHPAAGREAARHRRTPGEMHGAEDTAERLDAPSAVDCRRPCSSLAPIIRTPIGDDAGARRRTQGLCALEFTTVRDQPRQERLTRLERAPRPLVSAARDRRRRVRRRSRARARWLAALLRRHRPPTIGDLPLDMRGAPFEKRVWTALTAIPPGQTTSYGAIAQALESARRVARGRRRQRREPDRDHRALPSRHRIERIADRLRRRPRPQDVAHRPRAPLARRAATALF